MKIAILGYGTVGVGVYDIIKNNGLNYIEVAKIYRRKGASFDLDIMTDNIEEILNDDSIDTIVECMGGLEPAKDFIVRAMKKGKNIVTANKMLVATFYDELIKIADEEDVYFMFEASVGGGIPIIENLSRIGFVDDILGFKGILNGTTNYILDTLTNSKSEYEDILKKAQELGYAEKDPSSDIDGDDALYKTIISANVASRKSFSMENLLKFGIRYISRSDIDFFESKNLVCKLIAEYDKSKNMIMVMPQLFNKNEIISNIPLNNNYIEIYCETQKVLSFSGQGAGRYPTAHSIIQDLVRIDQNAIVPIFTTEKINVMYNDFKENFYIKYNDGKNEIVNGMTEKDMRNNNIKFIAKINE